MRALVEIVESNELRPGIRVPSGGAVGHGEAAQAAPAGKPEQRAVPGIPNGLLPEDQVLLQLGIGVVVLRTAANVQVGPFLPGVAVIVRVDAALQRRDGEGHVGDARVLVEQQVDAPAAAHQRNGKSRRESRVVGGADNGFRSRPGHPAVPAPRGHGAVVAGHLPGSLAPGRQQVALGGLHHDEVLVVPVIRERFGRQVEHMVGLGALPLVGVAAVLPAHGSRVGPLAPGRPRTSGASGHHRHRGQRLDQFSSIHPLPPTGIPRSFTGMNAPSTDSAWRSGNRPRRKYNPIPRLPALL